VGPQEKEPSAEDAGEGSDATSAAPEGTTGAVDWLVRYATSAAAARPGPFANPVPDGGQSRTLVRAARLGEARARVELSVHADDHSTLVMVSVFDPRTGRNGAECGVTQVPGDVVEEAVAWCLQAVAGQLVRSGTAGVRAANGAGGGTGLGRARGA
jgi:hypothetical protein